MEKTENSAFSMFYTWRVGEERGKRQDLVKKKKKRKTLIIYFELKTWGIGKKNKYKKYKS